MLESRGACIWLTGRSGAGKSTVTAELVALLEQRGRVVTVLDVVPELAKHPFERSSEGKLLRKALVGREVARHGGICICVTVSARAEVRERARELVGADRFLEVFFATPADVAMARKRSRTKRPPLVKRMRRFVRKARNLGRDTDHYEAPQTPALVVDTTHQSPAENARLIVRALEERAFLAVPPSIAPEQGGPGRPAGDAAAAAPPTE